MVRADLDHYLWDSHYFLLLSMLPSVCFFVPLCIYKHALKK